MQPAAASARESAARGASRPGLRPCPGDRVTWGPKHLKTSWEILGNIGKYPEIWGNNGKYGEMVKYGEVETVG